MKKQIISLLFSAFSLIVCAEVNYQVVPLPQQISIDKSGQYMTLSKGMTVGYPSGNQQMKRNAEFAAEYLGLIVKAPNSKTADVNLSLDLKSDNPDAYSISINKKGITIQGASESGVFSGIQTLRKSIMNETGEVRLPYALVSGSPRFGYRGTELDCARHFFPVSFIKKFIDILALHGINRFHWHLTDDQGWRFEVKALPELAKKASVRPCTIVGKNVGLSDPNNAIFDDTPETGYYTQEEMREVVAYAAERYITIIPEIDLPGHMIAALSVYPHLGCTGGPYKVWGIWGVADDVLCAGNPKTLEFLKTVYGELCDVFPSKLIHIGGDESPRVRWKSCPKCQAKMKELGLKNEAELQTYINKEMEAFLALRGRQLIGWDETLEGGLSENAAVMSWRGYEGGKAAANEQAADKPAESTTSTMEFPSRRERYRKLPAGARISTEEPTESRSKNAYASCCFSAETPKRYTPSAASSGADANKRGWETAPQNTLACWPGQNGGSGPSSLLKSQKSRPFGDVMLPQKRRVIRSG